MQVRRRGRAGRADEPDDLATAHERAGPHACGDGGEVGRSTSRAPADAGRRRSCRSRPTAPETARARRDRSRRRGRACRWRRGSRRRCGGGPSAGSRRCRIRRRPRRPAPRASAGLRPVAASDASLEDRVSSAATSPPGTRWAAQPVGPLPTCRAPRPMAPCESGEPARPTESPMASASRGSGAARASGLGPPAREPLATVSASAPSRQLTAAPASTGGSSTLRASAAGRSGFSQRLHQPGTFDAEPGGPAAARRPRAAGRPHRIRVAPPHPDGPAAGGYGPAAGGGRGAGARPCRARRPCRRHAAVPAAAAPALARRDTAPRSKPTRHPFRRHGAAPDSTSAIPRYSR